MDRALYERGNNIETIPTDQIQAFIGNSEKKCVLQLLAAPGEMLTINLLNQRFAQSQEPVGAVSYQSLNTLAQTIEDSHAKAGTYTTSGGLRVAEWQAIKAIDSTMADSIAGHNLALAIKYGLSLENFWGKTSTTEGNLRSPEARIIIFEYLSSLAVGQSINLPELAQETGLKPKMIHVHIQKLHASGFIEYEASEVHKQHAIFEINKGSNPLDSRLTRNGRERLHEVPFRDGKPTARSVIGDILANWQQNGKERFTYQDLEKELTVIPIPSKTSLSTILGLMMREGSLKRHHKITNARDKFSLIYLDAAQKEIIDCANRFSQGLRNNQVDIITEGLNLASAVIADKQLLREMLERDYDRSSRMKSRSFDQRADQIDSILSADSELTTRQVQEKLKKIDEGSLSLTSVRGILSKMTKMDTVRNRKVGNEDLWLRTTPPNHNSDPTSEI